MFAAVLSVIILRSSLEVQRSKAKESVFSWVLENRDMLEEHARSQRGGALSVPGCPEVVIHRRDGYTAYLCRGIGFGPDGVYCGLYFSPDDVPVNIEYGGPLEPDGTGYRWEQGYGNCWYYTERISERFFWYEYAS